MIRFVGLGEDHQQRYLYEADRTTKFRHVLWGDWLKVDGEEPDGFLRIIWDANGPDPKEVFIHKDHTIETRPLEIVFVDVGQGDGAVLITPATGTNERIVVIDAGEGDNMERFLNGRFRTNRGFTFDAAVITHPDLDHYQGFRAIFEHPEIGFDTIYHSGLVERPVTGKFEKVGGTTEDPVTGIDYITNLAVEKADIELHFEDTAPFGNKKFPPVMHAALTNDNIDDIRMLSTRHGTMAQGKSFMPEFAPGDGRPYTVEVLGPVCEVDANGDPRLRKIGNYGETKNGHSVLLKLKYNDFSVLFGGDLNYKAEKFILQQYAGIDKFPKAGTQEYTNMITTAAETFRCDVMKVCHHGSDKVTDAFLETVNPACFIISSGDDESHVHPRPDLLGRLGRFGRGEAPVILSTELQRSTREREDQEDVDALKAAITDLAETDPDDDTDDAVNAVNETVDELTKRNVEVYGAIYLKTDGERLISAFKIETGSQTKKWFYFEYVIEDGELVLVD